LIKIPLTKKITATEARNNFGRVLDEVVHAPKLFVVTRLGQPRAVILGVDQYQELIEELETGQEMNDPGYLAAVGEAREDIALGNALTLEELDVEMGFNEADLREMTQ
jgi:prevent-host-death family protein